MKDEDPVVKRFERAREDSIGACQKVWERAKEDFIFSANREGQWLAGDRAAQEAANRPALSISKIPNILRTLSGRQIMDRFERQYLPRKKAHNAFAEAMTKIDRAFMERGEAKMAESAAFMSAATTGHGWTRMRYDTLEDVRGAILVEECPVFSMLWPADTSMKHNLVDRGWHIFGEYWTQQEVREVFKLKEDVPSVLSWHGETRSVESTPGWVPATGNSKRGLPGDDITWVELMEWWQPETKVLLSVQMDPSMPWDAEGQQYQQVELFQEDVDGYLAMLQQQGIVLPDYAAQEIRKKVFRYGYFVRDIMLETGPIPANAFTFEAITGHRTYTPDDCWRFEGIVEILKDRQRLENMFWSSLIFQWMNDPKGVLLFEKGAFTDRNAALQAWASPNGSIELEKGTLTAGRKPYEVETGNRSASANMAESLMERVSNSVVEGSGLNPAILGNLGPDLRRISGQVVRSLQDSALMSNAQLFDNLGLFRRRNGALFLRLLSEHYDEQSLVEMVGEELLADPEGGVRIPPKEMWREDAWRSISTQEAVPSPDHKRAMWEGLVESGALQALLQSGAITPEIVAEIAPDIDEATRDMMRANAQMLRQQQEAMMMAQQQGGQPPQQ